MDERNIPSEDELYEGMDIPTEEELFAGMDIPSEEELFAGMNIPTEEELIKELDIPTQEELWSMIQTQQIKKSLRTKLSETLIKKVTQIWAVLKQKILGESKCLKHNKKLT